MQPSESHAELLKRLNMLGWQLKSEKRKNGVYVALGVSPTDEEVPRVGATVEMALANLYRFAIRWNSVMLGPRQAHLRKFASWTTNWIDQAHEIGVAYSEMPPFDQKAVPAWKALATESKKQADAIRKQIKVEVTDHPDPYPSIHALVEDVHHNKHFSVSRAYVAHPVWSAEDVVNFRIVHDVLGHAQMRADFSWEGENMACAAHMPLLTPLAREALFTQAIGEAAYRESFHGFGPQKVGFLDQFLHPVQEREGEHVNVPHGGIATPAPDVMDTAQAYGMEKDDKGKWKEVKRPGNDTPDRHQTGPYPGQVPMAPVEASTGPPVPMDPNAEWEPMVPHELRGDSGIVPPVQPESPRDYLGVVNVTQNAAKIDTQWPDEPPERQDQAIMNAFRVALLSPRKHIKWNAAHYQALKDTDPKTSALDLWDTLERAREQHNSKLGFPEGSHLAYRKQLTYLAHKLQEENPALNDAEAMKAAKQVIFDKTKEFEAQILQQNLGLEGGHISELKRYNMARKMVNEWMIEHFTPAQGWMPGQQALAKSAGLGDELVPGMIFTMYPNGPDSGIPPVQARFEGISDDGYFAKVTTLDGSPYEGGVDAKRFWQWVEKGWVVPEGKAPDTVPLNDQGKMMPGEDSDQLERMVRHASDDWQPALFEPPPAETTDMTGFANETSRYGAFMGAHLDAIAKVGKNIDAIRKAALDDIAEGGKGFTFRNAVMNMNLPGVGPKVASFVWLLLAPMTSELSIIDTHVLRAMRAGSENTSVKDYYKYERMQRAARDVTGYKHMPLGLYHWGMWDMVRNPGHNSDHSALRVLDPVPWDSPDVVWDPASTGKAEEGWHGWAGPNEFEFARPYMDEVARDYDERFGNQPQGRVPNVLLSPIRGADYDPVLGMATRLTAVEVADGRVSPATAAA